MNDSSPAFLRAIGGAVIWLLFVVAVSPSWTSSLLVFSPLVIVPLALGVTDRYGPHSPLLDEVGRVSPIGATAAALSFATDPGVVAGSIAAVWMVVTIAIAWIGLSRLLSRTSYADPGIAADVGLMFLVVGGVWLTIARSGLNPLGFNDAIVQLTAVHFHYAGLALPIVAAVVSDRLEHGPWVPFATVVGVPVTAAGITAGGVTEWVGATLMAVAGLAVAGTLIILSVRSPGHRMLIPAGISLAAGMVLALGWAWATWFDWDYLDLQGMARYHGSLNALGFGLLSLTGLNLIPDRDGSAAGSTSAALVLGRPNPFQLERLLEVHGSGAVSNPPGLLGRAVPDGYRRQVWTRPVESDDFEAAKASILNWAGHQRAGIRRFPTTPAIEVGSTLSLAIPVGPIAVTAVSRIVDVIDEVNRFGFTYSTLDHHPSDGEESFIVYRSDAGEVSLTVTAVWRPSTLATRTCMPVTLFLQNRAIGRYIEGISTAADA